MYKYIFLFISFWMCTQFGQAQNNEIDLSTILRKAVGNNLNIQLQEQVIRQADAAVNKGNAGQGLTIDAVGGASYNNGFTDLTIRTFQPNPPEVKISEFGVQSINANAGVEAGLMLYDGKAGTFRFQLLETLSDLQGDQLEVQINQIAQQVVVIYAELLKFQHQEDLLNKNLELIQERIQKIEDRIEFGKATQLDKLQVETSLNLIRGQIQDIQFAQSGLWIELSDLVNEELNADLEAQAMNIDPSGQNIEQIAETIRTNNPILTLSRRSFQIADLEEQLTYAQRRPQISSFASVNYLYQNNDLQQLAVLQNVGGIVGVNVRYNLFDNGRHKSAVQQAQIAKDISVSEESIAFSRLQTEAKKALDMIRNSEIQLELEQANIQTYQANYDQVKTRWSTGKLPEISLREAELALISSELKMKNLEVDKQLAYAILQLLMGQVID